MSFTESATLHHTCFVVNDVEKSAAALAANGIGPWSVWTIEPLSTTVRGRDVPFTFRIAFATVGGSSLELLSPLEGNNIYVDHLAEKGEGYHHTCLAYANRDEMQAAKSQMLDQGRVMVQSADLGELGEFCYFKVPELGTLVELLYVSELPPPEKTIG